VRSFGLSGLEAQDGDPSTLHESLDFGDEAFAFAVQ
jgi:hypothetical protein